MNSLKRYTAVLLVLAIAASFAVPVSATEIETENDTGLLYYDLLDASSYYFDPYDIVQSVPFYEFDVNSEFDVISILWDSDNSRNFEKVIFALSAVEKPTSVFFDGNSADYVDSITYSGYSVFFYSVDVSGKVLFPSLDIECSFDSPYVGLLGVYSCVGLIDTAETISAVDIYRNDKYITTEGYELSDTVTLKNKSLPYVFSSFGDDEGYFGSDFQIVIDGDDFVTPLVNKASILLTTCSGSIFRSVSLIAKDSSVTDVNSLTFTLAESHAWGGSGDYNQSLGMFEQYNAFQISVDLSGYDMSKYDLLFSIGVDTIDTVYPEYDPYLDLGVRSVSYVPFVENTPWYKSFFGPILNNIQYAISGVTSYLADFAGMVSGNFTKLFEKLEEYFGDDGSLSQAGDQMSEQAGQLNEANDSLNSVEKPTLDTGTMFGSLLDFDTGGLAILSCMTSNVYITQILIVVFTFALCGYVFFGKRG